MQNVLITGGAGFIGRAFFRRQATTTDLDDWRITAMSRDEAKLVRVTQTYPRARTLKGDVTMPVRDLARLFAGFDIIIHAAANKLIDIGERTVFETVRNNVTGADHVARAALDAGVRRVVGISTDKAVQPVNTYGATKFLLERLFQEAAYAADTHFVLARYGNVIGSTISIWTYFREQLARDGRIQVTDPEMTRFYMSADQGVDTIIYAVREASNASVLIPRMAAMSTGAVAALALGMDAWDPTDPRVRIIGARPGEKLHESLLHLQESPRCYGLAAAPYWELRPAVERHQQDAFEITSDKPPLGWMSGADMMRLSEEAKGI